VHPRNYYYHQEDHSQNAEQDELIPADSIHHRSNQFAALPEVDVRPS
jgi:hypothetical protein